MFTQKNCETLSFVGSQLISLNSLAPICAQLSSFKHYLIHLFCNIWIFFQKSIFILSRRSSSSDMVMSKYIWLSSVGGGGGRVGGSLDDFCPS